MRKFNIRNFIIVMLCITIIFMGIGFVALAKKLEAKNEEKQIFDVEIISVKEETPIKGGTIDPIGTKEINSNGKIINFNFTLNAPHDELAYTISVKNKGTIPAKIVSFSGIPDYINNNKYKELISPVSISHTNLKNKVIEPGETITMKLLVVYNMSKTSLPVNVPYDMALIVESNNK